MKFQKCDKSKSVVAGGKGKIAGGDVRSVNVNCSDKTYAIGGTITGLEGTDLVLQNNEGDDLPVNVNGTFAFATPLVDGASYAVRVKTQPANKWQTCEVTGGQGTVEAGPVTSIAVTCTTNTYAVQGTVSGLDGTGLVLQNEAGEGLEIAKNGKFEFATKVESGASYSVSVLKDPRNRTQTCTVTNGSGTITNEDVTNIEGRTGMAPARSPRSRTRSRGQRRGAALCASHRRRTGERQKKHVEEERKRRWPRRRRP